MPPLGDNIALPRWVEELDRARWLRGQFETAIGEAVQKIARIRDVDAAVEHLGTGTAHVETGAREDIYYQVLEEIVGQPLEVTPIIGTEKQGEELVQYLMDRFQENPAELWDFDIFGKKLSDLVRERIASKLHRMPDNAQMKLQETLSRIINEGSGGLIAIII